MTTRVDRPSEWGTIANHEQRIRIMEATEDCCTNSGFDDAVVIRDRAGYWYACGDGSVTDGSVVKNYGTAGGDGQFVNLGDLEECTPGTVGTDITGGWPLAFDSGSFLGCLKNYCAGAGYNNSPYIEPTGVQLDMANDFTVNMWIKFHDYGAFCNVPPTVDTYETSAAFGERTQGSGFTRQLTVYVPGTTTAHCIPPMGEPHCIPVPDPYLHACIASGGGSHVDVSLGIMLIDIPYMITLTWEAATTTFSVYANGGLVQSGVEASGVTTFSGLEIGAFNGGDAFSSYPTWAGNIDEVGIWDTECLTAGDVALLYFAGTPPPPVTASGISSGAATCGQPLCSDGLSGATWGNPCADTGVYVMPGSPTAQDVVDALIALGLVTQ